MRFAKQKLEVVEAENARLRDQLVITHSDLTDSIAENIRLREAIMELVAQELVPKYVEQQLISLLEKEI
jgi:hypothetical protein